MTYHSPYSSLIERLRGGTTNVLSRFAGRELHFGGGLSLISPKRLVEVVEVTEPPMKVEDSTKHRKMGQKTKHRSKSRERPPAKKEVDYPPEYEGFLKKASKMRVGGKTGKGIHFSKH